MIHFLAVEDGNPGRGIHFDSEPYQVEETMMLFIAHIESYFKHAPLFKIYDDTEFGQSGYPLRKGRFDPKPYYARLLEWRYNWLHLDQDIL